MISFVGFIYEEIVKDIDESLKVRQSTITELFENEHRRGLIEIPQERFGVYSNSAGTVMIK